MAATRVHLLESRVHPRWISQAYNHNHPQNPVPARPQQPSTHSPRKHQFPSQLQFLFSLQNSMFGAPHPGTQSGYLQQARMFSGSSRDDVARRRSMGLQSSMDEFWKRATGSSWGEGEGSSEVNDLSPAESVAVVEMAKGMTQEEKAKKAKKFQRMQKQIMDVL